MNNRRFVVMKFGGTSVASAEKWKVIGQMAKKRIEEGLYPVIVCSAISGASDQLEALVKLAPTGNFQDRLKALIDKHLLLAKEMGLSKERDLTEITNGFQEVERLLHGAYLIQEVTPRLHARVMGMGEIFSTQLGVAFLRSLGMDSHWVDARECLKSEEQSDVSPWRDFLSAQCPSFPDHSLQKKLNDLSVSNGPRKNSFVITQGFIAANDRGETVLLGRGGSDTSGAYFAARLEAIRCEIWTDVPGMYTANPRSIPEAKLLKRLHYAEAQEIASTGAKVLHPRCIAPLRPGQIPLHIYCTDRPELEGTVIEGDEHSHQLGNEAGVKSISLKKNVTLISIENIHMWQEVGYLANLFAVFKNNGLSIDLLSTSETNVTVSLDPSTTAFDQLTLQKTVKNLEGLGRAQLIGPCAVIGLVGQKIRSILWKLAPLMNVFEEQKIYMMTQAASDLNLSFVVDEEHAERMMAQLHTLLFEQGTQNPLFGPTWAETFTSKKDNLPLELEQPKDRWWIARKQELLTLGEQETPLYVYDLATVEKNFAQLKNLQSIDKIFYAMKANTAREILTTLERLGCGLECVSIGELDYLSKIFPKIPTNRILFTPNFAPRDEYEEALKRGIYTTIDNLYPLKYWPEIFKDRDLIIRLDPGKGRGHHNHVNTGGEQSKFGIALTDIPELQQLIKLAGANVYGLHIHAGSGIDLTTHWKDMAMVMTSVLEKFPSVQILNLGGGLGVPSRFGQNPIDLQEVDCHILQVKKSYPHLQFWLEPGRFLVASAGIILSKVTQLKSKGETNYIGLDTGMNSLIRPSLYGAYHPIVNLSRLEEKPLVTANVVGPICETGDTLGHGRRFPETKENDIVLIDYAGAYGRVMSSYYNLREPAKEVTLETKSLKKD